MKINIEKFKGSLPYASEIFGVFQPLIGWKSDRMVQRFLVNLPINNAINKITDNYTSSVDFNVNAEKCEIDIQRLQAGYSKATRLNFGSILLNELYPIVKDKLKKPTVLYNYLSRENIDLRLGGVMKIILSNYYEECRIYNDYKLSKHNFKDKYRQVLEKESKIGGVLVHLSSIKDIKTIKTLFTNKGNEESEDIRLDILNYDPIDFFDPQNNLKNVSFSPIGIVHLFRQYFFEFDTFLGSPVGHIWLSPGSSVELIEIHSRKTIIERTLEQSFESTLKTERSITDQDEISDAVKEDNKQDLKLGFAADVNQGWVTGSMNASASMDYSTSQQLAKEVTHKKMRQQTEKISTEIKKNYKSTFKTITETTDTSSKRYTLNNATDNLINYELRRKMRQVGVQVQDIGTYLCWQSYVDNPGNFLGLSNLIHEATSPVLDDIIKPDEIPLPQPFTEDVTINIPFVGLVVEFTDGSKRQTTNSNGLYLQDGWEHVGDFDHLDERIQNEFLQTFYCKKIDYELTNIEFNLSGFDIQIDYGAINIVNTKTVEKQIAELKIKLDRVHFRGQSALNIPAKLYWAPTSQSIESIRTKNSNNEIFFTKKEQEAYEKAFISTVKDRVNKASAIKSRKFEELREEERIIVYRNLIKSLVESTKSVGYDTDANTQHIIAEMINTIFDVDKMLYFVAPDWWKPKKFDNKQFDDIGNKLDQSVTTWGGSQRKENYYITEESEPAKLGSSLGWLLQLDGDNMRNAFLNAPWVKAVIPIRPGKERAAINWLKNIEGQTGLSNRDMYGGNEPDLQGLTLLQTIERLADNIKEKHEASKKVGKFPNNDEINDDNKVSSTPIDKVYEHGFYPLQGGFKAQSSEPFEVFDQWIEVLPTDQIVAVEVKYDSLTGMQIS